MFTCAKILNMYVAYLSFRFVAKISDRGCSFIQSSELFDVFPFSILRKVTIRKFNFRVLTTGRIKNVFEISFVGFTHGINCPGN
jgi:hypothetical protein